MRQSTKSTRRLSLAGWALLWPVLASFVVGIGVVGWHFYQFQHHSQLRFGLVGAASQGDTPRVKEFLQQGADPNSTHPEGSTALWWAVLSGHPTTVRALLEAGADPHGRGQFNSALEQAVYEHNAADTSMRRRNYAAIVALLRKYQGDR